MMTLGISSATSGASNLWSLLSSRAATSTSTAGSFSSTGGTTSASDTTTAAPPRPDGPPPPPSQFDSAMSTAQFANMAGAGAARRGPPPGEDPIASLDSDDDGSVSSDEFGLDGATDEVQQLFAAIDEDGSGDLSAGEIDSFREQMMSAAGGQPPEPPMGPPPGAGDADDAGDTSSSSTTTTSSTASQPDVSRFLQQLAHRYASLTADQSESALSVTA